MRRALRASLVLAPLGLLYCHATPPVVVPPPAPAVDAAPPIVDAAVADAGPVEDPQRWAALDAVVDGAIAAGKMPGCVVVVGRHDEIVLERAYGSKALLPAPRPMTADTVFDLASLTKPVATASSVMVLVDRGKLDLDARASRYLPELAALPPFTVRQLLLHTSGLPAGTPLSRWSTDRAQVLAHIATIKPKTQPGERFEYSDVGYVVLQQIVERIGATTLATFASENVFAPLGMTETGFLPPDALRARSAPTEVRDGGFMQGEVHDPRAFALGGVAGHAGVFSTAHDLARFAQALLRRGELDGKRIFSAPTFERMIAKQPTSKGGRALGWDVDSSFATHRSPLLGPRAFGHGGYTGTALWIDPDKDLFVLFLSNRVHPDGKGAVNPTIGEVATLATTALQVQTGIDVLVAEKFRRLEGAHVGLVTNASAKDRAGAATVDLMKANVDVRAIFTPEHGLGGDREGNIGDSTYGGTPVHSLYGERFTPSAASLDGVDTIVFDLQDVGMRFYTYGSTMKRALKLAADRHLRFVVLDRPNPVNGLDVQGPVLGDSEEQMAKAFVNYHPLPLRHGLTIGELAGLLVTETPLAITPEIVKLSGWRREDAFDATGLAWTAPSPNLRSTRAVALYPAIGLLESTNVSVGRGTDSPFEIVAAPWMDGPAMVAKLEALHVAGVSFAKTEVTPSSSVHARKLCRGIRVAITDPSTFEPIRTAFAIAGVLHELYPQWDVDGMNKMLRWTPALAALKAGRGIADIEATWATELSAFKLRRERALLYP